MNIYSDEDRFSGGILLILIAPLVLPHLYLHSKDGLIPLLILASAFIWILSIHFSTLVYLFKLNSKSKIFVIIVFATALINFIASFFLNNNKSFIWLFTAICFGISVYSINIYKNNCKET